MSPKNHPALEINARSVMNWSVILAVTLGVLVAGRGFLIPLAVAILLWSLIDAFRNHFQRLRLGSHHLPRWLATALAVLVMLLAGYVVYEILVSQANALQKAAPVYQANFSSLAGRLAAWLGMGQVPATADLLGRLNFGSLFTWLGGLVGALVVDTGLVAIYVGFLLVEQEKLPEKFARLQPAGQRAAETRHLAIDISRKVQRYMWVKTVVSLLTAIVAYAILKFVGLDFAATWALIIFFLNYIPNIGSVIGVIFPALLALVQFDTVTPFLFIVMGLGSAQFIIGNMIEPIYMGRSLNLSSFMILASLTLWGSIWGVAGMILSVPIMVIVAIICSHVPKLHWLAIFLSADGALMGTQPEST